MKNKILAGIISALLIVNTTSIPVLAEGFDNFNWNNAQMGFSDVPQSAWFYNDVSKVAAAGIMTGVGNNRFNPNGDLTHAEAMVLMAKVHAIYHGDVENLNIALGNQGKHWATGVREYCVKKYLPVPKPEEFDEPITRRKMAKYFRNAVPAESFQKINNSGNLSVVQGYDLDLVAMYECGVIIGNEGNLREDDLITRAETASVIRRVADVNARVRTQSKQPPKLTYEIVHGEVQTDKPYKRIPNTDWNFDPTGGVVIKSNVDYYKTKYGNHTYGTGTQEQYDQVLAVMDEAFEYACEQEREKSTKGRFANKRVELLMKESDKTNKFYINHVGITDIRQAANLRITESIAVSMRTYLYDTYSALNHSGENRDVQNNNVYKYLFGGGALDCDGFGYLNMLCWDYLGFSTRMISSHRATHACAEVYINGHWIILDQLTGGCDPCTHEQLIELFSGVKNDAYTSSYAVEPFLYSACEYVRYGVKHASYPSDMYLDWREGPTHDPENYVLESKPQP